MRKSQQLREEAKDILANAAGRAKHVVADDAAEALKATNAELRNEIELKNCLEVEREKSDKKYAAMKNEYDKILDEKVAAKAAYEKLLSETKAKK